MLLQPNGTRGWLSEVRTLPVSCRLLPACIRGDVGAEFRHIRRALVPTIAVILMLGASRFTTAVADPLFAAPYISFGTDFNPSVVTGDLNGDSKLDLAAANSGSNTVSVLLGNGDGTFGPKSDYGTGDGPSSVAIGDLNGDSKLDLAVANNGSNTVSVLLGNGDGTFGLKTDYGASDGPSSVAIGDVNGDGKLDLVVANMRASQAAGGVSVFLGRGDGTFVHIGEVGPLSASSVAVMDLNGDGKLDLAVTNYGSTAVSVLLGNGDGTFGPATSILAGDGPQSVAVGDLNGDGKADLAVGGFESNGCCAPAIAVLLGNGDGTFGHYAVFGGEAYFVAIGDLNGDGKLDLVGANYHYGFVSVLLGNGDGTFGLPSTYASAGIPFSIAIGDLDGNGKPDLAVAGGTVSLLLGNGDGTFGPKSGFSDYPTPGSPQFAAIGDLNGDHKPDLAVSHQFSGLSVLLGNGDGTFGPSNEFPTGYYPNFVAIRDLNGDGKSDVAVANLFAASTNGGPGVVSVLRGNGDGTFGAASEYAAGDRTRSVAIEDLNGDGKLDMAAANGAGAHTVSVFLGNGDGTFGPKSDYAVGGHAWCVAIGDLNGDRKPDLVVSDSGAVSLLLGNGDGTFQPNRNYAVGGSSLTSVAVGDLNGDSKLDLAVANFFSNTVSVLLGNGDGTFGAERDFGTGAGPISVAIADLNEDGKPDLAAADRGSNSVSVLLGNGDGTFGPTTNYGSGGPRVVDSPLSVAIDDLNGDRRPDLVVANSNSGTVKVLLNIGPAAPPRDPDCSHATASPSVIWEHEHRLVPVSIAGVTDADGGAVTITVTGVTQDEPVSGHGEGNTSPDAGVVNGQVEVRAERAGGAGGNGRVYRISFRAEVASGGACDGSVSVCVPHDRRPGSFCVDDGQNYNSVASSGSAANREGTLDETEVVTSVSLRVISSTGRQAILEYALPSDDDVSLAVFDIAGRRVTTLEQGPQSAGSHAVSWNTTGVARGMYFYCLQAGSVTVTRSVLILK